MAGDFLLYGATGYTGRLIARRAITKGMRPVVAGRNPATVHRLAAELGVEGRAFGLDDRDSLDRALRSVAVALHCAGPFAGTWRPMVEACLRTGRQYLDLTGEVAVHEGIAGLDGAARAAGVTLLPGVGFDLAPTDCLAAHVKERLPTATRLAVAVGHAPWRDRGGRLRQATLTRGTLRSALDGMLTRGLVRRGGALVEVAPAAWGRWIRVGGDEGPACSGALFPLGELTALHRSTGIPDIDAYVVLPPVGVMALRRLGWLAPRLRGVERLLPEGPSEAELERGESVAWVEAVDPAGRRAEAWLHAPNAYALTAEVSLAAVTRAIAGDAPAGYQTPSTAFGARFCLDLPGVRLGGS
jgi:short subunit dehydrogenase-like uncharacterized protein